MTPLTLAAIPLRVSARVTNPILLNEHKGSAVRGALFEALRKRSCARLDLASCHPCELVPVCPISALVATVDPEWERGADPPRPLVVDPPLDPDVEYPAGASFQFGVTVFGSAGRLLPYLVLALSDAGRAGIGRRYQSAGLWTRGRFEVERVELVSLFSDEVQVLYPADGQDTAARAVFRSPRTPVLPADVQGSLDRFQTHGQVAIELLTPTRLVRKGELIRSFDLLAFLQRLRERLESLERRYGQPASRPEAMPSSATYPFDAAEAAAGLRVVNDDTQWREVRAYSHRQRQALQLSGLTGRVTLAGDLAPILPYLAYGQLTHVGKDATKGNGWYRLLPSLPALERDDASAGGVAYGFGAVRGSQLGVGRRHVELHRVLADAQPPRDHLVR